MGMSKIKQECVSLIHGGHLCTKYSSGPVGGGCDFSQSPETKLYSILRITLVRFQEEFQISNESSTLKHISLVLQNVISFMIFVFVFFFSACSVVRGN